MKQNRIFDQRGSKLKNRALALVGGILIDGSGKEPLENATVLIENTMLQDKAKISLVMKEGNICINRL